MKDHMQTLPIRSRVVHLSALLFLSWTASGQSIDLQLLQSFPGVHLGEQDFADVDGDGDLDMVITGAILSGELTALYLNNGNGNFTVDPTAPFSDLGFSALAFGDIDGDNDPDLLISGRNTGTYREIGLFENDGNGTFSAVANIPFEPVMHGYIGFADVDGDNDLDVLIEGQADSGRITRLYLNDGGGTFGEVLGTPFVDVYQGAFDLKDVDGDLDLDVLITANSSNGNTVILYANDGNGNFTQVMGTPFVPVTQCFVEFADIDGDLDQDVLITGELQTQLYENDGAGNFSLIPGTGLIQLKQSASAFFDANGDGDLDLILSGFDGTDRVTKVYENNGSGQFTEVTGLSLVQVNNGKLTVADVDGDGDRDVLITGQNASTTLEARLYSNNACIATTASLVQSACYSYTVPSGNATYFSSQLVTDTLTNMAGCDSILTIDLTIDTVDVGIGINGITLTADAMNASYAWLDCDDGLSAIPGATAQSFTPMQNGNYAVAITQGGCTDTSACMAVTTVGIVEQHAAIQELTVFPDPVVVDEIDLRFDLQEARPVSVALHGSSGKRIAVLRSPVTMAAGGHRLRLQLPPDLAAGTYMLGVDAGGSVRFVTFRSL
ncbi:MAG: VCBS repeat-containing protein [Flavobacteriales bacterium]|nr:VCBS repeat-containing protein [Flavobacteriales bacterium]